MAPKIIVWCLCFLSIFSYINGQTYGNATALQTALLNGYVTDIMPLNNQSEIMNINMTLYLNSIQEVDTLNGILKIVAGLWCSWYDERLTWTPSDYGNVNDMLIGQNKVWTPLISLSSVVEFTVFGKSWMYVAVQSNGLVSYGPGDVISSSCTFNMLFWPFDKQVCDVSFFVYNHPSSKLQLQIPPGGFNTQFLNPNGEWTLEETSWYQKNTSLYSEAVFRIKLKRQSTFIVMTIIIPLLMLGFMNPLVFILPTESGERVGFSITVLLAITVFMTVISDMMPKTSDPVPITCVIVMIGMIFSVGSTIAVILNLTLYHKDDKVHVGSFYRKLVLFTSCCGKNNVSTLKERKLAFGGDVDRDSEKRISSKTKPEDATTEHLAGADVTWKDVSTAIDKILFISTSSMIVPVMILLIYMSEGSNYIEP